MAFPTTGVLDGFNRANGGLGADWTTAVISGEVAPAINTNQAMVGTDATHNSAWWDIATFGGDAEVYLTLATSPGEYSNWAIHLRLANPGSVGATDGYAIVIDDQGIGANDNTYIRRIDNDVYTSLGAAYSSVEWASGNKIGLEAIGSTLAVYRNTGAGWTQLFTRTDSTYSAAGNIGFRCFDNTLRLDDFGGGTVVVAGTAADNLMLMGVS